MERSFAQGTRYGFDQARWRGLWRMRIQEHLTCAIQNMQVLIAHVSKPKKAVGVGLLAVQRAAVKALESLGLSMPLRLSTYSPALSIAWNVLRIKVLNRSWEDIHHIRPLGTINKQTRTAVNDLITVCPNCHKILHRMKGGPKDIEKLKHLVR